MTAAIELERLQILAYRRGVSALDERLPMSAKSLRRAAWAGLQDSMPRAAVLSINARVAKARPDTWADPSLVQLWGPRFSVYVVAADDLPLFSLGRYPDDARGRAVAEDMANRLDALLKGRRSGHHEGGSGLGVPPNRLRYGAATGRILIRWEGARQPTIWTVPAPTIAAFDARVELARRYLHVFGPTTAASFAEWAGIGPAQGRAALDALEKELVPARTPIGDAWLLAGDEAAMRSKPQPAAPARLLPSGDTYYLLWGKDRELLIPEPERRTRLWTSRVWPGAVLVGGEVVGTWRRDGAKVTAEPWRALSKQEREAVEAEAASLPLPGLEGQIRTAWAA